MRDDERKYWLDDPSHQNTVFWALFAVCAALVAVDVWMYFFHPRHVHFVWEGIPGFYAAFGFVAFWCIVIAGKHLRKILKRDEDYYD